MPELTLYDSEGAEHTGPETTEGVEQRVRNLFYDSIRLAIDPGRRTTVYVFFRARATENARAEQFYAKYVTAESGVSVLPAVKRAVESRVVTDWGHTLATGGADVGVFRELDGSQTEPPGSEMDRAVVRELAADGVSPSVGVADERTAIGLAGSLAGDGYSVAVRAGDGEATQTDFDCYLAVGETRPGQLSYLGPETEWERAREQIRSRRIDAEIETVRESVETLRTTWGLDTSTMRTRVLDGVPELAPTQQSAGVQERPSFLDETTVRELAGVLAMVVGVVVLLVAAGAVGVGPLSGIVQVAGGGGESPVLSMNVSGGEFRANETVTVVLQVDGTRATSREIGVRTTAEASDSYGRTMSVQTNGDGVVWFELALPRNATTVRIDASLGETTVSRTLTVRPADPSRLVLGRSKITMRPGENVTLMVDVRDEFGNLVERASVNVTARSNGTAVTIDGGATQKTRDGTVNFTVASTLVNTTATNTTSTNTTVVNTTIVVRVTAEGLFGDSLEIKIQRANESTVRPAVRARAVADGGH